MRSALLRILSLLAVATLQVCKSPTAPDAGLDLAFISYRDADFLQPFGLYLADARGRDARRIYGYVRTPLEWSPDGSRIAVVVKPGNYGTISIVGLAGNTLHSFGSNTGQMSWAPDGQALAYTSVELHQASFSVEIFHLDGAGSSTFATGAVTPRWSPDGSRVAFVGSGEGAYARDIYLAHPDGSGRLRLTNSTGAIYDMSWSPDSRRIAFSRDAGSAGPEIFVVESSGGDPAPLTSGTSPVWSPDGSRIAFEDNGIFAIDVDGSGRTRLASGSDPAWSPDGSRLSFTHNAESGTETRIGVLDLATGISRDVDASWDMHARWRPRGR